MSGRKPRARRSGSTSAQFPRRPIERGSRADLRLLGPRERLIDGHRLAIEIPGLDATLDPLGVDLDADRHAAVHRDRERLGSTHPAEPTGEGDGAGEGAAEALGRAFGEGLVGALQDPLGPDVDPRPGRHLAVHGESRVLELTEGVPVGPFRNEHRVRDQHARGHLVGAEHADRLAGLHQERLVVAEVLQRADDRVVRIPGPSRATGSAVDDEVLRALGDLGIEIVHQHPHRGLLRPRAAAQLGSPRRRCTS